MWEKGLIYSQHKTCWVSICLDEKFSESHSLLNLQSFLLGQSCSFDLGKPQKSTSPSGSTTKEK